MPNIMLLAFFFSEFMMRKVAEYTSSAGKAQAPKAAAIVLEPTKF